MSGETKKEALTEYEQDVLRSAERNHIWLNAFSCIRPTDAFKLELAEAILRKLDDREETIPTGFAGQRCLVLRINKS